MNSHYSNPQLVRTEFQWNDVVALVSLAAVSAIVTYLAVGQ